MLKNADNSCDDYYYNVNADFQIRNKIILFITGNFHKFEEVRSILNPMGITVGMLCMKGKEIQSDHTNEIAENSATEAFTRCHLPLIVEDAGLFIDALGGFPGPYSAYVYKTIQNKGILKLMENIQNRKATFYATIAYYSQKTGPQLFEGKIEGKITLTERKGNDNSGFGFDPIFQSSQGEKTFAEMSLREKNSLSHRFQAVNKFAQWYNKQLI
ncbi:MAG: XTP/dITP diphosphatase [Nitrososphaerota archaeon]|jgi:XTP/dITP diphosphohydrolase|nr:XTP/dITP diphosphatase [Nitrososphaerota archaeon]